LKRLRKGENTMRKTKHLLWLLLILPLWVLPAGLTHARVRPQAQAGETILVGRISHVEEQLLRYVPGEKDWVATVRDTPFGMDDLLYSSFGAKAEIIMPNNTWIRVGGDTQIQLIELTGALTEIELASATARLYNKSSDTLMKAETPFGYVTVPAQTSVDLYVGGDAVEVIALEGTVYFVHNNSDTRHEVIAGSSSISADSRQVNASEGYVNTDWDTWNRDRDILWAERMQARGESGRYLPATLQDETYVLEKHGRWERVYYNGAHLYFWRPVYVSAGWSPFSNGRWTVWYGDNTWIPYEPFGYVTHHYGNWIFTHGCWYWAPPVTPVMVRAGLPLLSIGFGWYPGRVAWMHSDVHIGWIPLAPFEPYYCHRYWGRRSVAMIDVNLTHLYLDINRYRHCRQAVIISRDHFYRRNNYGKVRLRNIRYSALKDRFRMQPIISNAVIKGYQKMKERFNFRNVRTARKLKKPLINKIRHNLPAAGQRIKNKAETIRLKARHITRRMQKEKKQIQPPKDRTRIFPVKQVKKTRPSLLPAGKRPGPKIKARAQDQIKALREIRLAKRDRRPAPVKNLLKKRANHRPLKEKLKKWRAKKAARFREAGHRFKGLFNR
jgi:hypothetical protein